MIETINPFNEEPIKVYEEDGSDSIESKLELAATSFNDWSKYSISKRCSFIESLVSTMQKHKTAGARLMTQEMGKPLNQSEAEIDKCTLLCDYYIKNAERYLAKQNFYTDDDESAYVVKRPLGVVLSIMPWNFPLWQVFRFVIPTIVAGNTSLLKHASNVSGVSNWIFQIFQEAGFPDGVLQNLLVSGRTAQKLIADPRIQAVSFTGSTEVGKIIAKTCGENLKKNVLELGGSDPYVCLADADIELAAETSLKSRLINSGQSCIAAKRLIVHEKVYDDFKDVLVKMARKQTAGDPMKSPSIGPLAKKEAIRDLQDLRKNALAKGASLLYEQELSFTKGYFFPLSVLGECQANMDVFSQESFGPLVAIFPVASDEEAMRLANQSSFGLGAAIFSKDISRVQYLAEEIMEAGTCAINTFVKSDPRLPFGGTKESGIGRELSYLGLQEFVNIKSIQLRSST